MNLSFLGKDFAASLVVFLVALPLCLGIAVASGAPPAAGLLSGIIGGILVGTLAGSPLQVSGPAAGLVVLCLETIRQYGLPGLGACLVIAGALQMIAGFSGLGRWFRAVSPAVVHGMLTGIGILIVAGQTPGLFDLVASGGVGGSVEALQSAWEKGSLKALTLGGLTLLLLQVWPRLPIARLKNLPAPLVAIAVGTLLAAVLGWDIRRVTLPENLSDAVSFAGVTSLPSFLTLGFVLNAATLALVASAETLLCAAAVDRMTVHVRTDYDKELVAQGVGNLTAGVLGGLPITGVIVRSATNVTAGAKGRASAIMHGVWLLAFVALLPQVLRLIPIACLAAVLVHVGLKLVGVKAFVQLTKASRTDGLIFMATAIGIVATSLLGGIAIGIALSLVKILAGVSRLNVRLHGGVLHLDGSATFLSLPNLAQALEAVPPGEKVHIDGGKLRYVDHACLEALETWVERHAKQGGQAIVDWEALRSRLLARTVA